MWKYCCLLVVYLFICACQPVLEEAVDRVFINGRIHTMNPEQPQAEALAVAQGRIVRIGSQEELAPWIGEATEVVDLKGNTVLPGLIESHAHLLGIGQAARVLDLRGLDSPAAIAARVAERARKAAPGEWIQGRGWDQNLWEDKRFPSHAVLSQAAPKNPVCLTRVDGHAAWVNARAMQRAGINPETVDPPGGKLIRTQEGEPTGILIDTAESLVQTQIPPLSREAKKAALAAAVQECLACGITSFHDMGAGEEVIGLCQALVKEDHLPMRLNVMLNGEDEKLLEHWFRRGPLVSPHLTIRGVKMYADGALGSRGAALLEPYTDDTSNRGLIITPEDALARLAGRALESGFQVCTHAIGDRANRIVLNAYETAFKAHPRVSDPRFRIEHAQILDSQDLDRFAALGVIASMQPTHCTSDMAWVPDRIGTDRAAEGAYVWRKLLDQGVRLPAGSDAPVEPVNPMLGIYAAVTRQDFQGNPYGGWYPDQRMTREEALRAFTVDGAYAAFEEDLKGVLAPNRLADLVVLDRDLFEIPVKEILETQVVMTVVGGEVVYSRPR